MAVGGCEGYGEVETNFWTVSSVRQYEEQRASYEIRKQPRNRTRGTHGATLLL